MQRPPWEEERKTKPRGCRLIGFVPRSELADANRDVYLTRFVGTAIRLGYLLGIDRTGFRNENESQSAELNRKRLAWAACYMSDRQISVRLGKAFWSRGES